MNYERCFPSEIFSDSCWSAISTREPAGNVRRAIVGFRGTLEVDRDTGGSRT